jgi:hypothetical protein
MAWTEVFSGLIVEAECLWNVGVLFCIDIAIPRGEFVVISLLPVEFYIMTWNAFTITYDRI